MTRISLDEARILFDFLLPQLRSEQAVTQKIMAAVPLKMENFKPGQSGMSALELARHIALTDIWFLDAILSGRFGEAAPVPEEASTCGDVAIWYSDNFARRLPLLSQLTAADLGREVDFHGLRKDPAVAFLNIAIRHSVHHRGQLSAYLRAMGAKVPAIYVESADEPYPPTDGSHPAGAEGPPCF